MKDPITLPREDGLPDRNVPLTAEDLRQSIIGWLEQDDPTHWGEWERALHRLALVLLDEQAPEPDEVSNPFPQSGVSSASGVRVGEDPHLTHTPAPAGEGDPTSDNHQSLASAPQVGGELREKIARIVSPDAFRTRDRHYGEIEDLLSRGKITEAQAAEYRQSADLYPGRAYAKSDAILAALSQEAEAVAWLVEWTLADGSKVSSPRESEQEARDMADMLEGAVTPLGRIVHPSDRGGEVKAARPFESIEHPLYTVSEVGRRQLVRVAGWIEKEAYAASGNDDPEDQGLDEAARFLRSTFDLSDDALGIVRNASDEVVSIGGEVKG